MLSLADFEERLEILWQDFGGGPLAPFPLYDQVARSIEAGHKTFLLFYYVPVDGLMPLPGLFGGFNECQQDSVALGANYTSARLLSTGAAQNGGVVEVSDGSDWSPCVITPADCGLLTMEDAEKIDSRPPNIQVDLGWLLRRLSVPTVRMPQVTWHYEPWNMAVVARAARFDSLENFQAYAKKRYEEHGCTLFIFQAHMMPTGTKAGFQLLVRCAVKVQENVES